MRCSAALSGHRRTPGRARWPARDPNVDHHARASGARGPGDAPEGVDEDARVDVDLTVAGPEGGVITEVVGDTLFEGIQTVAIGLDEERPYRIERFEDPERIVINVLHD